MPNKSYNQVGVVDIIKKKILDSTTDYFKKKFESSKKEFLDYVEKEIERKIKRELKKIIKNIIFYLFFCFGLIFLSYGFISLIVYFLNLPQVLTNVFYGIFLILIGVIFKIIY